MKINILVVTGFWPTTGNSISGIFVVQQIAALVRLGCRVTVITTKAFGKFSSRRLTPKELDLPTELVRLTEVTVLQLPNKVTTMPGVLFANTLFCGLALKYVISRLEKENGPFNGGIVHGVRYIGLSIPRWRSLIDGGVVVVMHGFDPKLGTSTGIKRARPLFRAAANEATDWVIVGSPLMKYSLILGLQYKQIKVVLNGCELPDNHSVSPTQRAIGDVRQIVSVSNLVEWKGIDLNLIALAQIWQRRPELKWIYRIVGEGPERQRLEVLSDRLGIADRVSFLGRTDYKRTMREVAEADIFCLPSWGEAFGIVYLEAMARMRPVIGCLKNGAADFIEQGRQGFLVPPQDLAELGIALERLIEDPELASTMGAKGRETAEQLSWEENGRKILALLDSQIKGV